MTPRDYLAEVVSDSLASSTEGTDWAEAPEPSDEPGSPYVLRMTNEIGLRFDRDGYLLVSEAELATVFHEEFDRQDFGCRHQNQHHKSMDCWERAGEIFAALVAAQEKGETGS